MADTKAVLLKKKLLDEQKREKDEALRRKQYKILKARKKAGDITPDEKALKRKLSSTYKGSAHEKDEGGSESSNTGLIIAIVVIVAAVIGLAVWLL